MKKSQFTEMQIVKAIQEHEGGREAGGLQPGATAQVAQTPIPLVYKQKWEQENSDLKANYDSQAFSTKICGEAPGGTSEQIFSGKNIGNLKAENSNWP